MKSTANNRTWEEEGITSALLKIKINQNRLPTECLQQQNHKEEEHGMQKASL